MDKITLELKKREVTGKKNKKLRDQGIIPGVIYGHKEANKNVSVEHVSLEKAFASAGESTIIDLKIEGDTPMKAIIKDVQKDIMGQNIIHVDFHQVKMDEKMTADIGLKIVGEAPVIKQGGMVLQNLDHVSVECLPNDLVHEIEVDVSSLDSFDKNIQVKDLKVPNNVKILTDEVENIITVEMPRDEIKVAQTSAPEETETKKEEEKKEETK